MHPVSPQTMYGRYYYGQEFIRNDDANIQFHRSETSGLIRNAQPIDSFGARRMQAIGPSATLENVGATRNNDVLLPSVGNFRGYGSVNGEQTNAIHNNGSNNDRDGGIEWNRHNYQAHGGQPPNLFGSNGQRPLSSSAFERQAQNPFGFNRQSPDPFEIRGQRETLRRNNIGSNNDRDGGIEWNRHNYQAHGGQPPNLFGSNGQRPLSFSSAFERQAQNPFGFNRQSPDPEIRGQRETLRRNNIDVDDARHSSSSSDRRNYSSIRQPTTLYDFSSRQSGSFGEPTVLFENRSQGDDSHNIFFNDDDISHNERAKLIVRIKKYYDENTVKKNSERFDNQSWVKVYYVLSGGLKVYGAKVTCPVCFGITSPYNRESEPGRLPRWDLHATKRHIFNLHSKRGAATETVTGRKSSVAKNKKATLSDVDFVSNEDLLEEKIEPPPERKKDEPVEKEVEETKLPEEERKTSSAKTVQRALMKDISKDKSSSKPIVEEVESSEEEKAESPTEKKKKSPSKTREPMKKSKSQDKSSSKPIVEEVESSEEEKAESPTEKKKKSSSKTREPMKKSKSQDKSSSKPIVEEVESSEEEKAESPTEKKKKSSSKTRELMKKSKSQDSSSNSSLDSLELSDDTTIYSTSDSDSDTKRFDTKKCNRKTVSVKGKGEDTKKRKKQQETKKLSSKKSKLSALVQENGAKKQLAQLIQTNGILSGYKHPIDAIATEQEVLRTRKSKKSVNDVRGVNLFNEANNTHFM